MEGGYKSEPYQTRNDDVEIAVAAFLKYGHTIACHAPPVSGNQTHLHEKGINVELLDGSCLKLSCEEAQHANISLQFRRSEIMLQESKLRTDVNLL